MKLTDIITFDDLVGPAPNESLVKTARLFYVGNHKGREYSEDDLIKIVENFNPDNPVPVQLDHSLSARDQVGILRRVWLDNFNTELYGELEILGRENVERVRLGLWKKVSVGLIVKEPEMRIMELSITPFPALQDAQIYSQDNIKTETTIIEELKNNNIQESIRMDYQAEIDRMESERRSLLERINTWQNLQMVDNFIRMGKTTPAMRESEIELLSSLNDSQKETFAGCKEIQPAFFLLGAEYEIGAEKPGEREKIETSKEALEILRFVSQNKNNQEMK